MRNIFKRALAVLASTAMCGSMLLYYPSGTFEAFRLDLRAQAAVGIAISAENFPDGNFRGYVNDYINRYNDGILTMDEILNVWEMRVKNMGIADLTGVEYFTALTYLFCDGNTLTSLDVSQNTELKYLLCYDNKLTSLDVSENTELIELACYNNNLTALNVSANTALEYLDCTNNALTSLDVSANTALTNLHCEGNPLLCVNAAGTLTDFSASSLTAFEADSPIIRLADYGILADRISNTSGCSVSENGEYLLLTGEGTASYTYNVDGTNTMEVSIRHPGGIAINADNFPDGNFRSYVSGNIDTNNDTVLTADEIAAVTHIDVCEMGITNLTGVEYFTALETLACYYNQLTSLDVSKNTALKTLYCDSNQLTSLDVSDCTALETLYCYSNKLTSLDVSKNTALKTLRCYSNQLTSLDVDSCAALEYLDCDNNQLKSIDVSNNTALEYLDCDNTQLKSLDVSKNTELTHLLCKDNQLTSLDVSANTELEYLLCGGNELTTLDLMANTKLTYLHCMNNPLLAVNAAGRLTDDFNASPLTTITADTPIICLADYGILADRIADMNGCSVPKNGEYLLLTGEGTASYTYNVDGTNTMTVSISHPGGIAIDEENFPDANFRDYVSGNIDTNNDTVLTADEIAAVTEIYVTVMGIEDLTGVEYFTALKSLYCYENQLTTLDVSANTKLESLYCDNNELTSLDVSANTALTDLHCYDNRLTFLNVS